MKPCEQTCPKCGSGNLNMTHFSKGFKGIVGSRSRGESNEYVKREEGLASYRTASEVLKECIVFHCTCCGYEWDGPVLADCPVEIAQPEISSIEDYREMLPPWKAVRFGDPPYMRGPQTGDPFHEQPVTTCAGEQ